MFQSKRLKLAFNVFLIITAIFAVVQFPLLGVFLIGGVFNQGILGGFSGKVGNVVGGKWKDIDYMRVYVIPSNPNTAAQQTVRTKFSKLVDFGKKLLSTILQVYWDPFHSDMSGFNAFISANYSTLDGSNDLVASSVLADGTLESIHTNTSTYSTSTGEVEATIDGTIQGNGLATDELIAVAYDKNTELFYVSTGSQPRSGGLCVVTIPTGLTATNIICYVFAHRGTGASFVVSPSVGDVCAAA